MAGRIKQALAHPLALWLALAYLAFKAAVIFWPASWWFEVRRVLVFDAIAGAEVLMEVDREIHRPFLANWFVVVRRYNDGAWEVVCTADGSADYRPEAALPDPLTLDWWTQGACPSLPPGRYLVSTIWTIPGRRTLPDKVVQTASNVFTVE